MGHGKLSEGLMRSLSRLDDEERISIIVRYDEARPIMRHGEAVAGAHQGYHFRLRPFVQMNATPEAIHALEDQEHVVGIYEDVKVHALLDTSVPLIGVPRVWNEGLSGANVRIAVLDTGVDPEHPDLAGRIGDMVDFTGQGPLDRNGHGTHCCGVAAGSGAAGGGRYRGVAPGAIIYSAKVLGNDGQGMMSDVMAGVEWAVNEKAQIFSLSLGSSGPCDGTDALSEMCNAAAEAGVVACVAAGNDGPGNYTIGSPGGARDVITVGACDDTNQIANFSSRGPTQDGRIKPDIVLPGVDIVSARANGTFMGRVVDSYYTSCSGTSMATPHAAGLCALLLEAEPHLTPAELKERLMDAAIDLGLSPYAQGSGRADAWGALQGETHPQPDPTPEVPDNPETGPTPGQGCLFATMELLLSAMRRRR